MQRLVSGNALCIEQPSKTVYPYVSSFGLEQEVYVTFPDTILKCKVVKVCFSNGYNSNNQRKEKREYFLRYIGGGGEYHPDGSNKEVRSYDGGAFVYKAEGSKNLYESLEKAVKSYRHD